MKASTRRLLAYGSNATLVTVMVLVVLVLGYVLADQFRLRWDLSAGSSNTLAPDTLARLRVLDQEGLPVEITAFTAQSGKPEAWFKNRSVSDLLEELDRNSTVVSWRVVDFDKERLTAERLGVTMYGQIVIQRGTDRVDIKDRELFRRVGKVSDNRFDFNGEAALTRAFAQLLTPRRRVVYVLSGHGELDPEEHGPSGMSDLVDALDQERYDVETLDLLRAGREGEAPDVPEDAAVVFIARPRAALNPQEEDVLLAWLGRGKPLLIAVDVDQVVPGLLGRMGVTVSDGVALDKELMFPFRDRPIPRYKAHPITEDLRGDNLTTVLASPAALNFADPPPPGTHSSPVLVTSRDGWVERGGALEGGVAVYDPDVDSPGPLNLALALDLFPASGLVRAGKEGARVLVVGDGDAFTNALMEEGPGNTAFAVNAIHWLVGEDARLGAGPSRSAGVRRLALTKEDAGTVRWISLGLMPLLVGLMGLGVWSARRGR